MSKYAFSESFGELTDKDTENAVLSYKPHVVDHILQHYEIHVNSHDREKLTSPQLLYYHVYGDYRLVLDDKKPKFVYKTTPVTDDEAILNNIIVSNRYYLNRFLQGEQEGIINGIYDEVQNDGALVHRIEAVDWMNTELKEKGAGTKFTLPSIGTEIVKMHAYGNASDGIKKGLADEMYVLSEFLDSDYENHEYPVIYQEDSNVIVNRILGSADRIAMDDFNGEVSKSIAIFIEAFLSNIEFVELNNRYASDLPDISGTNNSIHTALREVYLSSNDYDTERAIKRITSALFGKSTQRFDIGDRVMLSENLANEKRSEIATLIGADEDDVMGAEYVVYGFNEVSGYILQTVDLVGGAPFTVDLSNAPIDITLDDNDLIKTAVPTFDYENDSGDVTTTGGKKKKKGGSVVLNPIQIAFQRILLDTFASIQILCHINEWAKQRGDNANAKTEAKMRFLSRGVNVYTPTKDNNQKKKQGDNSDKTKLKPHQVYNSFPNVAHFDATRIVGIPPSTSSKTKLAKRGLLDEMADWRAYYTLSILSKIRKKTLDRQTMDNFYKSNIMIKEIAWMATALSDGAKVLSKKEDMRERDLMAQIQYRSVARTDGSISQTAVAPKETVFYEVDVPLLKEVIMTYTEVYNKSVIYRAYNTAADRPESTTFTANSNVEQLVRDAYKANKEDNKDLKNQLLGQAMALQPDAFKVDQPYGWDSETKKAKTRDDASPYPGITYIPRNFTYHVEKSRIPRNIDGADKILGYPDALAPDATGDPLGVKTTKEKKKPVREADLAKQIWTSVRTRTTGLFDLEGARPHEFMLQLFNQMDDTLSRSKLIKSPYPDSWLGTNIIDKLTTDPMQLGESVETRFYEEKLAEYITALEKRYISNYLVPSVLLTQTQMGRIKYSKNPEKLKMAFMERLAKDAAKPRLVTTNYILRPYAITVSIMRAILQIPKLEQSNYVAKEIDEDMRTEIRKHMYHNDIRPLLPKEHPLWQPRDDIPTPAVATGTAAGAAVGTPAATPAEIPAATPAEIPAATPERRERPLPSPEPRRVRVPELPTTPDLSLFDEFDEALEDFGGEM